MKRALRPRLEPKGPEGIPLVGVRPSSTTGTLLRGGSCVGDPKVRLLHPVNQRMSLID